jgi:hypothetical protein
MSILANVSLSGVSFSAPNTPIAQNLSAHYVATTGLFNSITGGTAVTNGGTIKRWEDQKDGPKNNLSFPTLITPPFFTSASAPALINDVKNGLPVVRFSSDVLIFDSGTPSSVGSMFFVMKNNDSTNGSLLLADGFAPPNRYVGIITNSAYNVNGRDKFIMADDDDTHDGLSGDLAFSGGSAGSNFIVGSCFYNQTLGVGVARLNGVSGITVGNPARGGGSIFLGGDETYPLNADIGEILIYNRLLTEYERTLNEDYLRRKWAVY